MAAERIPFGAMLVLAISSLLSSCADKSSVSPAPLTPVTPIEHVIVVVGEKLPVSFLELVRYEFQEDQPQDNMLVFGGIHVAAQDVRHRPDFLFKAYVGRVIFVSGAVSHKKFAPLPVSHTDP